ncbi:MAG: ATP-binding protein [Acidobacteriota bacterium]|nr:ATP-binding protein [Acidobacteriota bacterium]
MFILLNGSFGIGKSTVALELRSAIKGAAIYDPEPIGLILMHLTFRRVLDFQDLSRWRRLTILAARAAAAYRTTVIIPMAFSNLSYLDEIKHGLAVTGRPVRHFCLTAPWEVVQQRLAGRGHAVDDPKYAWVHRRAIECVEAHRSPRFAVHVATDGTPSEVAADIVARLATAGEPPRGA